MNSEFIFCQLLHVASSQRIDAASLITWRWCSVKFAPEDLSVFFIADCDVPVPC